MKFLHNDYYKEILNFLKEETEEDPNAQEEATVETPQDAEAPVAPAPEGEAAAVPAEQAASPAEQPAAPAEQGGNGAPMEEVDPNAEAQAQAEAEAAETTMQAWEDFNALYQKVVEVMQTAKIESLDKLAELAAGGGNSSGGKPAAPAPAPTAG